MASDALAAHNAGLGAVRGCPELRTSHSFPDGFVLDSHHRGPLRRLSDVEVLTLNSVHRYNTDRLHSELGYLSPEEYEQALYARTDCEPVNQAGAA